MGMGLFTPSPPLCYQVINLLATDSFPLWGLNVVYEDDIIHPVSIALLPNPILLDGHHQLPLPFGPMSLPSTLFKKSLVSFTQINNMLSTCVSLEDYEVVDGT